LLGVELAVTDLARLSERSRQETRLAAQPIAFRQRAVGDAWGIHIQLALAPHSVAAPSAPRLPAAPKPSTNAVAAEAETPAPRMIDATLDSDESADQAPEPPAAGPRDEPGADDRIPDDQLPPPGDAPRGDPDFYGDDDR
jgi:hypothetical protein